MHPNPKQAINHYYKSIVDALLMAEKACIPQVPVGGLKPFWNDHLNELKDKSIYWHNI